MRVSCRQSLASLIVLATFVVLSLHFWPSSPHESLPLDRFPARSVAQLDVSISASKAIDAPVSRSSPDRVPVAHLPDLVKASLSRCETSTNSTLCTKFWSDGFSDVFQSNLNTKAKRDDAWSLYDTWMRLSGTSTRGAYKGSWKQRGLAREPWLKSCAAYMPGCVELALQEPIVSAVRAVLDPHDDVVLQGIDFLDRDPGQVHRWHSDVNVFDCWETVTVWIAIENVSPDLGTSPWVLRQSHYVPTMAQDALPGLPKSKGQTPAQFHTATERLTEYLTTRVPHAEAVQVSISDGDFVMWQGRTWHGVINPTNAPRHSIIAQFAAANKCALRQPLTFDAAEHIKYAALIPPVVRVRSDVFARRTPSRPLNHILDLDTVRLHQGKSLEKSQLDVPDHGGHARPLQTDETLRIDNRLAGFLQTPCSKKCQLHMMDVSTPVWDFVHAHVTKQSAAHQQNHGLHYHGDEEIFFVLSGMIVFRLLSTVDASGLPDRSVQTSVEQWVLLKRHDIVMVGAGVSHAVFVAEDDATNGYAAYMCVRMQTHVVGATLPATICSSDTLFLLDNSLDDARRRVTKLRLLDLNGYSRVVRHQLDEVNIAISCKPHVNSQPPFHVDSHIVLMLQLVGSITLNAKTSSAPSDLPQFGMAFINASAPHASWNRGSEECHLIFELTPRHV